MCEHKAGTWVSYDDYKELEAQLKLARGTLRKWQIVIADYKAKRSALSCSAASMLTRYLQHTQRRNQNGCRQMSKESFLRKMTLENLYSLYAKRGKRIEKLEKQLEALHKEHDEYVNWAIAAIGEGET